MKLPKLIGNLLFWPYRTTVYMSLFLSLSLTNRHTHTFSPFTLSLSLTHTHTQNLPMGRGEAVRVLWDSIFCFTKPFVRKYALGNSRRPFCPPARTCSNTHTEIHTCSHLYMSIRPVGLSKRAT